MFNPGSLNTSVVASSLRSSSINTTILRRFAAPSPSIALQSYPRPFSTSKPFQFKKSSPRMVVHIIKGKPEYQEKVVDASNGNLVILDCFATWCGPCKAIAPTLSKWSEESDFSGVKFIKIDVDESPDVAQELGVRAMPTFLLFKDGQKIDELVGADPTALRSLLEKHK